jgi:multiple sugar transport system permease protein
MTVAITPAKSTAHKWNSFWAKLKLSELISLLILIIGAILMFAPFIWMISTAFQPGRNAFSLPPKWLPLEFSIENYANVLFNSGVPFHLFAFNSFLVAGVVTVGQLITCSMGGFAFARLRFPGSNTIFVLLLAGLMVPIQVTIIPIYIIMRQLNLVDTLWALILPWITNVFGIFLMRQFFLTLPQDLLDAARIDGASIWRTYYQIALPLARPMLVALAIITFTNTWNNYFLPLIFINSWDKMTLPLGMQSLSNVYGGGNVGNIMAGVSVAVLPVLIFFLLAQKQIIEGMMAGSIKG